jgi:general secretion pathway protein I
VRSEAAGFTLIEVLVALAIVTIGMAAVLEALTSSADTVMYLENKTFAQWVALDQMEHVRLSGSFPADGTRTGELEMAGRNWEWRQKVVDSQVPGVRQITVDVRPAKSKSRDGWYASVIGAVGNSAAQPNPLIPMWVQGPITGNPTPGGSGGQLGGSVSPP